MLEMLKREVYFKNVENSSSKNYTIPLFHNKNAKNYRNFLIFGGFNDNGIVYF